MNEQILELIKPARRSRLFATEKSFRFLFPGGTSALAGADTALEAFRRAFSATDDVAMIVGCRGGQADRLDWLADLFADPESPDVEFLRAELHEDHLRAVLRDVDALVYPFAASPDLELLRLAVEAEIPMILPEDPFALANYGHRCAYLAPSRAVEVAAGDGRMNLIDPQDLVGLLRQVQAEPEQARDKALRAKQGVGMPGAGPGEDEPAICWGGAALDYSGYAKTSRNMVPALMRSGARACFHSFHADPKFVKTMLRQPTLARTWRRILERQPHGGLYVCFHPPFRTDGVSFMGHMKSNNPDFEAHVAYTMFETDRLPRGWADQLNVMDEVWVPSEFNVETFARSGVERHKLKVLPLGIDPEPFANPSRVYPIPGRKAFNFLSIFDWTLRKGWDVLLAAWLEAFSADDDVSLTIRAYAAIKDQPPIHEQIETRILELGHDPDRVGQIILIEDFVSDDDMPALYAAADAFVLPTRGEGWGMPLIEAMAAGLPTIATRWSGQLAFMTDQNSFLIDCPELSPVAPEQTRLNPFYEPEHRWAEPDIGALASIMREVMTDPAGARSRGLLGQREVAARFNSDEVARQLRGMANDVVHRVRAEKERRDHEPVLPEVLPNIAWVGPVYDESGYADEGRGFLEGLFDRGLPLKLFPLLWSEKHAEIDAAVKARLKAAETGALLPGRPVVLLQHALGIVAEPHPQAAASIARTMFETASLPPTWADRLLKMDAVFVPSEFNRRSFAAGGIPEERIWVVPGSIDAELYREPAKPIEVEGGKKGYTFLSVFDWTRRKGWDVLLRAYLEEFKAGENVSLVLKVWSSLKKSSATIGREIEDFIRTELGLDPDDCPDILILDRHLGEREMPGLYAAADCYVQPTRGEGWGRPIMEAMASGLPVLATNWGGNMEFMSRDNSYPIECAMVPCSPEAVREAAWFEGQLWAEPHVPHLRHLMRGLFAKPDIGRRMGQKAKADVLQRFNRERVSGLLLEAVEEVLARQAKAKQD